MSFILSLDVPIPNVKGGTYESFELSEPTGAQVKKAEAKLGKDPSVADMRAYQIALIAQNAGVQDSVIEMLPISKINEAFEYLQNFCQPSKTTDGAN